MDGEGDLRQARGASTFPDLMNDPAYATNINAKGKGVDEPDTCRICRGEGSDEEQLFYPCKCSGSIKFVHQNCLMEWLSHSQKKYCELCKTPFRFTKLYDPDMPSELPAPVFVKELIILGVRSLLTWLRFVLVAFVWLGWLPWSMRAIWRALFWLADGRWPSSQNSPSHQVNMQAVMNGTTHINHTLAISHPATSTAMQAVGSETSTILSPMTSILNFSTGEPMVFAIAKRVFLGLFVSTSSTPSGSNPSQINTTISTRPRQPSWLSNVTFLNSLTSSPTVNNIVIDTLEGQLITLLVVISFILVFLIREWVVQQQPAVNVADDERDAVVQLIAEPGNREDRVQAADDVQNMHLEATDQQLDIAQDENNINAEEHFSSEDESPIGSRPSSPEFTAIDSRPIFQTRASSSRPILPSRNALDEASNIQRTLEETASTSANPTWPGIDTFKELWTRGEGNPDRILQIIQEEGREEELGWVVNAMTKLKRANTTQNSNVISPSSDGQLREILDEEELNNNFNENIVATDHRNLDLGSSTFGAQAVEPPFDPLNDVFANTDSINPPRESQPVGDRLELPNFEARAINPEPFDTQIAPAEPSLLDTDATGTANAALNAVDTMETAQQPLADRIFDWFWGDLTPSDEPEAHAHDDEHIIENIAQEAPFVPVPNRQNDVGGAAAVNAWQDLGAAPADNREANDVDVVEEADDFEGILELIGMQGPIFGLLQNGVFSALLISFTIAVGIWLPYLWGKIALVFLTSPIQLFVTVPLAMLSIAADVAVDTLIGSVGYILYWASIIMKGLLRPVSVLVPIFDWIPQSTLFTKTSLTLIDGSSQRLKKVLIGLFDFQDTDLPMFSVLAHQALRIHEARIAELARFLWNMVRLVVYDFPIGLLACDFRHVLSSSTFKINLASFTEQLRSGFDAVMKLGLMVLGKLNGADEIVTIVGSDQELARWDTKDRVIAILIGYTFASLLGVLYLRINSIFSAANRGQRVEGVVADILHQAGGVMKVILIIGIEMIVFPLYCGLLLDLAMMPLFKQATLASRIDFTVSSPLTSLFIHWFVGTCYMFHFALFVSMCRKIMRAGVLYFIRDPDDPTFHPVRDVLERNIVTQLRKIAFSALVYGALVIVCLGGVVWGLALAFDEVLPIHWSSKVPVLEFPVDLLFYNSIMPLAIRAFKPSDILNSMYNWWFRVCARYLRLSHFLLGERHQDEEGRHIGRSWTELFTGKGGNVENPVVTEEDKKTAEQNGDRVYFLRDGRFVRAPASDQVRIPKGTKVFLDVTEQNERIDGAVDNAEGLHGKDNDMFAKVYVPPNFRLRVSFFIFTIWVYAAVTGIGVTILPLVVGRKLLSFYFPNFIQINDLYAFSVGLYLLGGTAYALFYSRSTYDRLKERVQPTLSLRQATMYVIDVLLHLSRLVYLAAAFALFVPSLLALLMELYVLIPIHSYTQAEHIHVIHFIQDWTLGVLYVQMTLKFIQWRSNSRLAIALNAITRDGWFRPNVSVATRAFILPALIIAVTAVVFPLGLGFVANTTFFHSSAVEIQSKVYRYAYPTTLTVCLLVYALYLFYKKLEIWRANIRDEVYLIGERLHNFSEKRARDVAGVHRRVSTS
ncbi:RING finger membrane protein [Talaromyces proteolyticus]|uniref:RING-type E3 ubiquitin transferase n=1 Tax=Talaromyces proteolyticus TaxID=1131652 RepID=A0AAD4PV30_9EURO|nr:RING finger membrane protein [Talaromyces proteolyticus]KAH8696035.1 RING finger membrane protein [Talaromyces proteolyticus]